MKSLKGEIQEEDILEDNVGQFYKVIETFKNCVALAPLSNRENFACEIMEYKSMDLEMWTIVKKAKIHES